MTGKAIGRIAIALLYIFMALLFALSLFLTLLGDGNKGLIDFL